MPTASELVATTCGVVADAVVHWALIGHQQAANTAVLKMSQDPRGGASGGGWGLRSGGGAGDGQPTSPPPAG